MTVGPSSLPISEEPIFGGDAGACAIAHPAVAKAATSPTLARTRTGPIDFMRILPRLFRFESPVKATRETCLTMTIAVIGDSDDSRHQPTPRQPFSHRHPRPGLPQIKVNRRPDTVQSGFGSRYHSVHGTSRGRARARIRSHRPGGRLRHAAR